MTLGQLRPNGVSNPLLLSAIEQVNREKFLPPSLQEMAYCDHSLQINPETFLLEPLVLARLIQALDIQPGDKVLHVNCGTGYGTALLARMGAQVYALASSPSQAQQVQANLAQENILATIHHGSFSDGLVTEGPFQAILIEGAIDTIPITLRRQLVEGGYLAAVCYFESNSGMITLWQKTGKQVTISKKYHEGSAPRLKAFHEHVGFMF